MCEMPASGERKGVCSHGICVEVADARRESQVVTNMLQQGTRRAQRGWEWEHDRCLARRIIRVLM